MQLYLIPSEGGAWFKKNHPWKIDFLVDWLLSERKGHKMLAGLLAIRWCKSLKTFVYICIKHLILIRVRTADPAWLCIFHLSLCITKSIKVDLGNKETDQFLERLISPVSSFSFSGWIPIWSVEAHSVYLFALASKTHVRGSPRGGAPSTIQVGTSGLRRQCNPLVSEFYWFSE